MRRAFSESILALASLTGDRRRPSEQATPKTKSGIRPAPMDVLIPLPRLLLVEYHQSVHSVAVIRVPLHVPGRHVAPGCARTHGIGPHSAPRLGDRCADQDALSSGGVHNDDTAHAKHVLGVHARPKRASGHDEEYDRRYGGVALEGSHLALELNETIAHVESPAG